MTNREALLVERDGGVLTLTNNDDPINRMSFEYMDQLEEAVKAAAADPEVRVQFTSIFEVRVRVRFTCGLIFNRTSGRFFFVGNFGR